jgi:hypothetical protein
MPIFTISFELRNQSKKHDYNPLLKELQAQKCHPLMQNLWLGSFNNNALQVHEHFKQLIEKTDRLLVCEMTKHYAYSAAMPNCNKWLELNPPAELPGQVSAAKPAARVEAAKPAAKKPAAAGKKKTKA